jgi:hypothetical protein
MYEDPPRDIMGRQADDGYDVVLPMIRYGMYKRLYILSDESFYATSGWMRPYDAETDRPFQYYYDEHPFFGFSSGLLQSSSKNQIEYLSGDICSQNGLSSPCRTRSVYNPRSSNYRMTDIFNAMRAESFWFYWTYSPDCRTAYLDIPEEDYMQMRSIYTGLPDPITEQID